MRRPRSALTLTLARNLARTRTRTLALALTLTLTLVLTLARTLALTLALTRCDVHAVRGGGGAAAAALRYPFVTFVEDASGELRAAMGPAAAEQAPESYLVDSIGTAVSCCVGASGHAEAAMEYAST